MVLICAALCSWGCGADKPVQKSDMVMDTVVTLSASGAEAETAVTEGMARLHELEKMVSPNLPDSDVSRLAQMAGSGQWVVLHPEVYHLLAVAQDYAAKTNGAFDITAKPLVDLWGIGTDHSRVPAPAEIAKAQKLVGWQKLELDEKTHSARLLEAGMGVDAGGIAKGMAADEVRKIYRKHGIKNGLINLGGSSLYALGVNNEDKPWRIGLRHPRKDDAKEKIAVLPLSDEALSTSGDYERFFETDGQRYHHIIDPRLGRPAPSGLMSVTITAADKLEDAGMLTDLLTTTVFVLGPEQGTRFLRTLPAGISGALVDKRYQLWTTHDMAQRLEEVSKELQFWQESGELQ